MSGEILDFKNHIRLQLVKYCQVHEEEIPRNIQASRTKEGVFLGTSGNLQGRYKFMALNLSKKVVQKNWDLIPMLDTVISCINTLGRDQSKILTFTDTHGILIVDV